MIGFVYIACRATRKDSSKNEDVVDFISETFQVEEGVTKVRHPPPFQ
jgi:hypothetical protein